MKAKILPFLIKNAIDFNKSVNPKAAMGFILKNNPDLRKNAKEVLNTINELIKTEIEPMSIQELKHKLKTLNFKEPKKEAKPEGPLKPLKEAKRNKVTTRIAPSPSGPLHIGHAYGTIINSTYAKMYNGKFILRIEDTNPDNIYKDAYKLIEKDVNWLTDNNLSEIVIQSDRLKLYFKYAEQLIKENNAYICTCDPDIWREMKAKKAACSCRTQSKDKNQTLWKKFFKTKEKGGFAQGEAVLKLKTDINHKNPAMRDFSLCRINDQVHPRTKSDNRVWPLMVFSVAIDDHELGITHVLNGKDHHDNGKKEALILTKLNKHAPIYQHWGRINFEGLKLSTSKTKLAIEQKKYTGWDDIRLATLLALKRRGYQPEALKKFATGIGLSLTDKTVSQEEFWKNINSFNKEIIEPIANRYFAIEDPTKITIKDLTPKKITLDKHPDNKKKGKRTLNITNTILIEKSDKKDLKENQIHRLIDCCNFTKNGNKFIFHSEDFKEYKNAKNKGKIIHFLPDNEDQLTTLNIRKTNHKLIKAVAEKEILNEKQNNLIQLERKFFTRVDKLDKKTNELTVWQLHS